MAHDTGLPPEFQSKIESTLKRADKWRTVWEVTKAAAQVATVVLLVILLVQNGNKSDEAKSAADAAKQGVHILNDCLTPGGQCFADNQANQAAVLAEVSDLQTYHSLCIRDTAVAHTVPAINACVDALIKEYGLG